MDKVWWWPRTMLREKMVIKGCWYIFDGWRVNKWKSITWGNTSSYIFELNTPKTQIVVRQVLLKGEWT